MNRNVGGENVLLLLQMQAVGENLWQTNEAYYMDTTQPIKIFKDTFHQSVGEI